MKKALATISFVAFVGAAPFAAFAQSGGATATPNGGTSMGVPPPGSPDDNGAIKGGRPIASDPNGTDTRSNGEAVGAPGAAGPIEGGNGGTAPAARPKANANGEGGGVQNPGLGSGINGSSTHE